MIYNFRTSEDSQQWVVDPEALTWARASSIIATPSVKAAASNIARFVPVEEGRLIPMGGGRYALAGRKPFDTNNKPQLSAFILLTILSAEEDGVCVTFMQANVDVKDLQHQEIKKFRVECLQATPAPTQPPQMSMPPITKDEQKAQEPPQVMDEVKTE